MKIKIYTIGKIKESWLGEALKEYEKRLKPYFEIIWHLAKDGKGLQKALELEKKFVALDPKGQEFSSPEFSQFLHHSLEQGGCRLAIAIGGDEGLNAELKSRASSLISLSQMTFTHQMTRLILLEQLYRAAEIDRGSPYHK